MLKIFCDETWTVQNDFSKVKSPTIVFYGIMLDELAEQTILQKIEDFKKSRGLLPPRKTPVEVKWQKVEDEWKEAKKSGKPNRYEDYLNIFIDEVKSKQIQYLPVFV